MSWRLSASLSVVWAALAVLGCRQAPPTTPTAVPVITAIAITGLPTAFTVGASAQLAARVTFSDGASKDATNRVAWNSSDPSVATISSSGLLRIIGPGDSDITAAYEHAKATTRITATPRTYELAGFVHESAPTEDSASRRRGLK